MPTTQNQKEPTWYEKTVEYAFVRKFLNIDAMPLSGAAEKIGDTMFYEDNHFYIVEFKRGKNIESEIESEQNKYSDHSKSMGILATDEKNSHYVIFGKINKQKEFGLFAALYVDLLLNCSKPWPITSLHTGFTPITSLKKLRKYLQLLIEEKESSSSGCSNVDYGNTLIVDKDGNACALSDKDSLQKELNLKFAIPKPREPEYNP